MKPQAYPRILLHSDLHLETGPFTLPAPPGGDAVLVVAGDVYHGDGSLAALRALSALPTVFVAGNHDFWGADYFERLAALKARAAEQDIHFLENKAVVLHGVRFLGATLWTDYGGGHPALMRLALWRMRDNEFIKAARWWTPANRAKFVRHFGEHALEKYEGMFNPLLALELHRKSRAWLKRELTKPFDGPTVIVTHHAPAFDSLRHAGVSEHALNPAHWVPRRNDDLGLVRVGAYASEVLDDLADLLVRANVRLVCHGHLHTAMHYAVHGTPVAANPRGRVRPPLTLESARAAALHGLRFTAADIERSQQAHKENPEMGDGDGYGKARWFDLSDTGFSVIAKDHAELMTRLAALQAELKALRPLARFKRQAVADLAGYRADALWHAVLSEVRGFAENMYRQLGTGPRGMHEQLNNLLSDCKLSKFPQFAAIESRGGYEHMLDRRAEAGHRPSESRALYLKYSSAQSHIASIEKTVRELARAIGGAPHAAQKLHEQRLSAHKWYLCDKQRKK